MATHRVTVWGKQVTCETYQKSKSVWIASGDYLGQSIDVKGSSEGSAVKLWRTTAEYRGG